MTPDQSFPHTFATLRGELLEVCHRFADAAQGGTIPKIEEYLGEWKEPARSELLRELITLECYYLSRAGETVTADQFVKRFPDDASLVQDVFGNASTMAVASDGESTSTFAGKSANFAPRSSATGQFGDYEILEELGKGGMGVVYKARQVSANRIVALKLIRPDQLSAFLPEEREKVLARFRNEVQAAAQLEHDHVVTVYDVGEIDGQSYYAMRFVEGESLKEKLAEGPLEPQDAARYMEQIAGALAAAHALGILHRDLKPHNVMIDAKADRALLADFGLAKLTEGDQQLTATEAVMGSPPYMSPEQTLDSGKVTAASDIYGLGATLYHLLTGRPPFQAASPVATMIQVQTSEPVSPRELKRAVPLDLETICLKCLEKQPAHRFASAADVADRLARVQRSESIPERPLGAAANLGRWCHKHPFRSILYTLILMYLLSVFVATGLKNGLFVASDDPFVETFLQYRDGMMKTTLCFAILGAIVGLFTSRTLFRGDFRGAERRIVIGALIGIVAAILVAVLIPQVRVFLDHLMHEIDREITLKLWDGQAAFSTERPSSPGRTVSSVLR